MLQTLDGKSIDYIPHAQDFAALERCLGPERLDEVRADLNRIIDDMPPDDQTGQPRSAVPFLARSSRLGRIPSRICMTRPER